MAVTPDLHGLLVDVYWNLHRDLYSVRRGGIVVAHVEDIMLTRVTFRVGQAGRERVLREGRKNVHAYVRGTVTAAPSMLAGGRLVTYNPRRGPSFVRRHDGAPVGSAGSAWLATVDGHPRVRAWQLARLAGERPHPPADAAALG